MYYELYQTVFTQSLARLDRIPSKKMKHRSHDVLRIGLQDFVRKLIVLNGSVLKGISGQRRSKVCDRISKYTNFVELLILFIGKPAQLPTLSQQRRNRGPLEVVSAGGVELRRQCLLRVRQPRNYGRHELAIYEAVPGLFEQVLRNPSTRKSEEL